MKDEKETSEQDSMMADVQTISKKEHKKRTCGKADRFIQCLYESVKENVRLSDQVSWLVTRTLKPVNLQRFLSSFQLCADFDN